MYTNNHYKKNGKTYTVKYKGHNKNAVNHIHVRHLNADQEDLEQIKKECDRLSAYGNYAYWIEQGRKIIYTTQ